MKPITALIILLILGTLVFVLCKKERKTNIQKPAIRPRVRYVKKEPIERIKWNIGSTVPPLPLSTMSSIRISRNVLRKGGPGDPVWDYNHIATTGPNY